MEITCEMTNTSQGPGNSPQACRRATEPPAGHMRTTWTHRQDDPHVFPRFCLPPLTSFPRHSSQLHCIVKTDKLRSLASAQAQPTSPLACLLTCQLLGLASCLSSSAFPFSSSLRRPHHPSLLQQRIPFETLCGAHNGAEQQGLDGTAA